MLFRHDTAIRLVAAATPDQMVAVAMQYLQTRGFRPVHVDGAGDGGSDLRLFEIGAARRVCVQVTVQERGLEAKVRADVAKVTPQGAHVLYVFTSRRVQPPTSERVKLRAFEDHGVSVEIVDGPALVSDAVNGRRMEALVQALGLDVGSPSGQPESLHDLRDDLVFAYAFFGADVVDFRRSVLDRAVLGVLCAEGAPMEAEVAVSRALQVHGLSPGLRAALRSGVDRLRQRGAIVGPNGTVEASPAAISEWRAMRATHMDERRRLKDQIRSLLETSVRALDLEETVETALALLAAVTHYATDDLRGALGPDAGVGRRTAAESLHALKNLVDTVCPPGDADAVFGGVIQAGAASAWSRTQAAGALFMELATLPDHALSRALLGNGTLRLAIDSSVALPLLCISSAGPVPHKFYEAAAALAQQWTGQGRRFELPRAYLEEVASHLIQAWDNYAPLMDAPQDLRASRNSFVAHFAALHVAAPTDAKLDFGVYVEQFGLTPALRTGDFQIRRDALCRTLQRLFLRYGVDAIETKASLPSAHEAQQALLWLEHETYGPGHDPRPEILFRHDASVLAWAAEATAADGAALVLVTWDRLIVQYAVQNRSPFTVLDPLALADALGLLSAEPEAALAAPQALGADLTLGEVQRASTILDTLATLEKARLQDGEIRSRAARFKDDYLRRAAADMEAAGIQRAWEAWKRAPG